MTHHFVLSSYPPFSLPLGLIGISFKTQALYATVFLTRYTDLFTNFQSLYNTTMKIFFIASSLYIVYLMKFKFKATNDPRLDTFKVQYVVGGAAALALIANYAFTVQEVKCLAREGEGPSGGYYLDGGQLQLHEYLALSCV